MGIIAKRVGSDYSRLNAEFDEIRSRLRARWSRNEITHDAFMNTLREIEHLYQQRVRELDQRNMARKASDLGFASLGQRHMVRDADGMFRAEPLLPPLHDADTSDDNAAIQGEMFMNILKTKVIGVKFLGNGNTEAAGYEKLYHYFTDDLSIAKDDYCIVIGASGAPCIVKVYEDAVISKSATKMIVSKIDLVEYNEKMKTLVARSAALKRLKEIEEEQTAQEKYKHLAAKSEEAAELLKLLGFLDDKTVQNSIEAQPSDPSIG